MTGFTRTLVAVAAVSSAIVAGPSASAGVACGSTFGLVASPNAASGDTILEDADAISPTNAWAVGTGNGAAFALRWDGSTWHWSDQGTQPGANGYFFARAVTYVANTGARRIEGFSTNGNGTGHLLRNYWDGANWNWSDQGLAGGRAAVGGPPAVITY